MSLNYKILPENIPNEGILYIDHEKNGRSGHLSHALVEYKKGCVMSFYANSSGTRNKGHSGFGWIEYKRSTDNGKTWGEAKVLPYSWDSFINAPFTIACEKAVSTEENEIIAFCTKCVNPNGWEPYLEPSVVISKDGGETWSEAHDLCDKKGRIYDAIALDGVIYVLFHAAPDWPANSEDQRYYIYESKDKGESFSLRGELPGSVIEHGYGSMALLDDGALICYTYNQNDEFNLDYHISYDMGKTFSESGKSFCAKRIRNPQVAKVNGGFLLHGRSGGIKDDMPFYFVLYSSTDGINWDEGKYVCETDGKLGYYSNNIVLEENGKQKVLIQASVCYSEARVNIAHWFVEI